MLTTRRMRRKKRWVLSLSPKVELGNTRSPRWRRIRMSCAKTWWWTKNVPVRCRPWEGERVLSCFLSFAWATKFDTKHLMFPLDVVSLLICSSKSFLSNTKSSVVRLEIFLMRQGGLEKNLIPLFAWLLKRKWVCHQVESCKNMCLSSDITQQPNNLKCLLFVSFESQGKNWSLFGISLCESTSYWWCAADIPKKLLVFLLVRFPRFVLSLLFKQQPLKNNLLSFLLLIIIFLFQLFRFDIDDNEGLM